MKILFSIVVLLAIVFCTNISVATPFDTGFITWTQPDSITTFIARYWGDEFEWWFETQTEYRIIQGSDYWYYYATLDANGDYTPTSLRVGIDSPPPSSSYKLSRSQACINSINQLRQTTNEQTIAAEQWYAQKQSEAGSNPVVINIGIIFVEFTNVTHYKSLPNGTRPNGYLRSDFDSMLFSNSYWLDSSGTKHPEGDTLFGSFRDYWNQMSRGKLIVNGTFINPTEANGTPRWLRLSHEKSYYYSPNYFALRDEAYQKALDSNSLYPSLWQNPSGFDRYIYIFAQNSQIIAGRRFLTHAGDRTYIQVPERNGENLSGGYQEAFAHIGTYCHEFGHDIGFFDEYYSRGAYGDIHGETCLYSYDLMAWGIYNGPFNKGECPATLSSYYRIKKNWVIPIDITMNMTNLEIGYSNADPIYYRIIPPERTTATECFILETKKRERFDLYVPNTPDSFQFQTGTMLLWHHDALSDPEPYLEDRIKLIHADNTEDWNTLTADFFPDNTGFQVIDFSTIPNIGIGIIDNLYSNFRDPHFALYGIQKLQSGNTLIQDVIVNLSMSENTTWKQDVYVSDLSIMSNRVLSIEPPTNVIFDNGGSLTVNGKLIAKGTPTQRITFISSNANPQSGNWEGITCSGGGPDTLTYCDIKYATTGVSFTSTSPNSYMAYDTVSKCLTNGVNVSSTGTSNTALRMYKTQLKNNGQKGLSVSNAKVYATYSKVDGNGSAGINPGISVTNAGKLYLDTCRVENNVGSGIISSGTNSRVSLSKDEVAPGINQVTQHGISEVYTQLSGTAFLGNTASIFDHCDCPGGSPVPLSPKERRSGVFAQCSPPCYAVYRYEPRGGWNNVFNSYTYNCRLINNTTTTQIKARYNYWGTGNNKYCGSVDTTYSLGSAVTVPTMKPFVPEYNAEAFALENNNTGRDKIREWLKQLREDVETDAENGIDALHQLELYVGPGGTYSDILPVTWEKFLELLEDNINVKRLHSQIAAMRVQAKLNTNDFAGAYRLAERILQRPNLSDEMWFFCHARKVFALAGLGDMEAAQAHYQAMREKGESIDKLSFDALGEFIQNVSTVPSKPAAIAYDFENDSPKNESQKPKAFALHQNYPNPFNPTTVIRYQLQVTSMVTLTVFDVLGREVASSVNEIKEAGNYLAEWDASNIPSGVYFYTLTAVPTDGTTQTFSDTKKMLLVR